MTVLDKFRGGRELVHQHQLKGQSQGFSFILTDFLAKQNMYEYVSKGNQVNLEAPFLIA